MNFGGAVHVNRTGICIIAICSIIIILYMTKNIDVGNIYNNKESSDLNIRKLLLTAIELAEKGGQEVINVKNEHNYKIKSKGLTNEGANDPVTEADYKSHCVMYYGFKKMFPTLQIVSEEERSEKQCEEILSSLPLNLISSVNIGTSSLIDEELPGRDITVWIDPLDATQEFTENLLEYVTTLVCIAYKGRPIIGVIHKPFGQPPKTSWAWLNRGVSPDLVPSIKANSVIIVSRSHTGPVEKLIHDALGNDVKITKAGGAGYKVMQIISGNATAYIHSKYIKKWDVCAGNAILNAVGGQMTTLKNEDLDYSFNADPVNSHGIIATLNNHDYYAKKLEKFIGDHIV